MISLSPVAIMSFFQQLLIIENICKTLVVHLWRTEAMLEILISLCRAKDEDFNDTKCDDT